MEKNKKLIGKKTVCKKDMCTGCMACVDICPKSAIKVEDSLDAYNAVIDEALCVNCNICHKICQNNQEIKTERPIAWYQGWAKSQALRAGSSSGGVAAVLSRVFIKKYGTVCSCTFQNGEFKFVFANSADELDQFAGSKYVKSNPVGVYKKIKTKLKVGEKVLFIGLPCQIAAVKLYIGKEYEDELFTVDLICHGTPSPKLLEMFLNEHKYSLKTIENIQFRKKTVFHLYENFKGIEPDRVQDSYTYAFLNCVDYTENCYDCKYAQLGRVSDITIGDSWGSKLETEEQQKGVSLILCQTEKGKGLLEETDLMLCDVNLEESVSNNKQLRHPSRMPETRYKFFSILKHEGSFKKSFAKCYPKVFYKEKLKAILVKLKILQG